MCCRDYLHKAAPALWGSLCITLTLLFILLCRIRFFFFICMNWALSQLLWSVNLHDCRNACVKLNSVYMYSVGWWMLFMCACICALHPTSNATLEVEYIKDFSLIFLFSNQTGWFINETIWLLWSKKDDWSCLETPRLLRCFRRHCFLPKTHSLECFQ